MYKELRKTISRMGLIYCLLHLIMYASKYVVYLPIAGIRNLSTGVLSILISTIPLYLIGLPTAFLLFKRIPDNPFPKQESRLSPKQFINYFAVCYAFLFLGGIMSSFLEIFLSYLLGKPVIDPAAALVMSDVPQWMLFTATLVIAPIGEEILFRYLPYKKLSGYGIIPYMFITSLFFGLFHMNFFQGIYTFLAAFVFAYVYHRTGRIIYSIILHMLINTVGSVIAPLASLNETASALFSLVLILVSSAGIFKALVFIIRESSKEKEEAMMTFKPGWILNPGALLFIIFFVTASIRGLM